MPGRSRVSLIFIILCLSISLSLPALADRQGDKDISISCSTGGMVSTACPEASAVGISILESGGNAVDAAIAAGFALAVTYPSAGNIGGGGFLLARMAGGKTVFIDFRETAPSSACDNMYLDARGQVIDGASTLGHKSAGVPGTVAGLYKAWKLYGTKSWEELLAPAIKLAGEGFPVSYKLALSLRKLMEYDAKYPALKMFYRENGRPLVPEDVLVQPQLAQTLMLISSKGPDSFYRGRIASLIVAEMRRGGGLITQEDLRDYRAVVREPLSGTYRGLEIISAPPPSSGGVVLLEILNILEGFDLKTEEPLSGRAVHWMVEAEKRAYCDRSEYLGDPDFNDIPVAKLISKKYAEKLRAGIGERATSVLAPGLDSADDPESEETTHYSIVDREGNAVAVTVTLNSSFGSKVIVGGAGFLLNNEMDDFSVKPGVPNIYGLIGGRKNSIQARKRMLSSMTPTIVLREGKTFIVLGTPGGSTIITTVAQLIVDMVDFCMSPSDAVSTARFHHQWMPDLIYYEKGAFPAVILKDLIGRGHKLEERESIGDAQVIMIQKEEIFGVSDPRGGGKSIGIGR